MQLSLSRVKLGFIGVGLIFLVIVVLYTGSLAPGYKPTISIEWGIDPDLEGLPVEIDGQVVGKLEKIGMATHTGFEVSRGEHTVRVLHPSIECRPEKVEIKSAGEHLHLLLDYEEASDAQGRLRQQLVLRM